MMEAKASDQLDLELVECELVQRGVPSPYRYFGPGRVDRDDQGQIILRVDAQVLDDFEAMTRVFGDNTPLGELVPETAYYDLTARDASGAIWSATRLDLNLSFGFGSYTKVHAEVRRIECRTVPAEPDLALLAHAFIPGDFKTFVWARGGRPFEGESLGIRWALVPQGDEGLLLEVIPPDRSTDLRELLRRVLIALAVTLGHSLAPTVEFWRSPSGEVTRHSTQRRRLWGGQLQAPFKAAHGASEESRAFVTRFLIASDSRDLTEMLYQHWHQVLRVSSHDIANSALVLSVGIEAIAIKAFAHQVPIDQEWMDQLARTRAHLDKALDLPPRVLEWMRERLRQATQPTCRTVLEHLCANHFITKGHITAWNQLRNRAAHGQLMPSDDEALAKHLRNYFSCLGLFYALMAAAVGYSGPMVDYSQPGWPTPQSTPDP